MKKTAFAAANALCVSPFAVLSGEHQQRYVITNKLGHGMPGPSVKKQSQSTQVASIESGLAVLSFIFVPKTQPSLRMPQSLIAAQYPSSRR